VKLLMIRLLVVSVVSACVLASTESTTGRAHESPSHAAFTTSGSSTGPTSIDPTSDQWVFSWNLYAASGQVTGRFFTETNGTPLPFSPNNGYAVTGLFWNAWISAGGVSSLGFPVSQVFNSGGMDMQVFQQGVLQLNADGSVITSASSRYVTDHSLIPAQALATEKPPDTPIEVAEGDPPWGRTYTFGGGTVRIVNGQYSGVRVVDRQAVQAVVRAIYLQQSKIQSYSLIFADTTSLIPLSAVDPKPLPTWTDADGTERQRVVVDWSSIPATAAITSAYVPYTYYLFQYAGVVRGFPLDPALLPRSCGGPESNPSLVTTNEEYSGVTAGGNAYVVRHYFDPPAESVFNDLGAPNCINVVGSLGSLIQDGWVFGGLTRPSWRPEPWLLASLEYLGHPNVVNRWLEYVARDKPESPWPPVYS
jgi:hypothetical protein